MRASVMFGRVFRWLLEPLEGDRNLTCSYCAAKVTGETPMCPMCGHDMSQTLLAHEAMNTSPIGTPDVAFTERLAKKRDELDQAPMITN